MTDEKMTQSWVYSPTEPAKIIILKEGGKPPKGWYFSPADIPVPKPPKN